MKILLGVFEVAGLVSVFAKGLRALGHDVTTVTRNRIPWWPTQYDVDLSAIRSPLRRAWHGARLIRGYDVAIFLYPQRTLLPYGCDLPLLKARQTKIISVCLGSDIRSAQAYRQWYADLRPYLEQVQFPQESLAKTLRCLRRVEWYSDLIFSVPDQSILGVRPYLHLYLPLDMSEYNFHIPAREIPRVVHIPSRKGLKGTEFFLRALEELQREGVPFDLQVLHDIPNAEVLREFENSDIVLDELFFPLHGKTTLEALACGCAIVNGDNEQYAPHPPQRPIWSVTPDNLKTRLRELLSNQELRVRLAVAGRQYIEKYYDHVKVVERMLDYLNRPSNQTHDYYPTFFAKSFRLAHGEKIPSDIKIRTTRLIQRWGLPEGVAPGDLVARGLISPRVLTDSPQIPRWDSSLTSSYHEATI